MVHEKAGEKGPNITRRILSGAIGLFGLALLYVADHSGDWTQKTEPIRIPSDAVALSDDQDLSKRFRTKAESAASIFCGKVVRYFIFSDPIDKTVSDAGNGNVIVECDTAGMDIPVERAEGGNQR